ncbi:MAG: Mrp/NBP35 family ATP-binding protein [Nitrospirae bacterium]|nr:Mrp/NBP35 family ATP-binding protein [Nitrospirota bacterium]
MACVRRHTCSLCDIPDCAEDREAHNAWIVGERMSAVGRRFLVMGNKGGVGKSTVAVNLAAAMAASGRTVGLADADIHGPNTAKMLGAEGRRLRMDEEGVRPYEAFGIRMASISFLLEDADQPVVWRDVWKYDFLQQLFGSVAWGPLDALLVDLPPGTGNETIATVDLLGKVDGVILVTTPQEVALLDVRKAITFVKENGLPLAGLIENMAAMACPHCGGRIDLFTGEGVEAASRDLGVPLLGRIPFDPAVAACADAGRPFVIAHPEAPAAASYQEIARKVLDG